ncbi:MAG: dockerin type I domain-containing protein [Pirellulaceae bacterium]
MDVNLDGQVSPLDALLVINAIGRAESLKLFGGCSCGALDAPRDPLNNDARIIEVVPVEQTQETVIEIWAPIGGCSCRPWCWFRNHLYVRIHT